MTDVPDFDRFTKLEENFLAARLEMVRAAITHAGEKGRSLENEVAAFLRAVLPSEYGISTGFIAYLDGENGPALSRQLDVVIFDASRGGPLVRLGACDVFPLESVYGYVEVKAALRSASEIDGAPDDSLEYCLKQNQTLRGLTRRSYYQSVLGSVVGTELVTKESVPVRGFVVAFSATGAASDPDTMAQRMADASAKLGAPTHLHGVFIVGHAYFRTRPVDRPEDRYHVQYVQTAPLAAFKSDLLKSLSRFPRYPQNACPALDRYFKDLQWSRKEPR